MKTSHEGEWLTVRAAAELVGVRRSTMRALANRRGVAALRLPGARPLLCAEEVRKLAKASVKPATIND